MCCAPLYLLTYFPNCGRRPLYITPGAERGPLLARRPQAGGARRRRRVRRREHADPLRGVPPAQDGRGGAGTARREAAGSEGRRGGATQGPSTFTTKLIHGLALFSYLSHVRTLSPITGNMSRRPKSLAFGNARAGCRAHQAALLLPARVRLLRARVRRGRSRCACCSQTSSTGSTLTSTP